MKSTAAISVCLFFLLVPGLPARAQETKKDTARYEEDQLLPREKQEEEARDQARVRLGFAVKKAEEKKERQLVLDSSGIERPKATDFSRIWHFPPKRQGWTGTCWSFSTTSFLESEIYRLSGRQIKLSEMYPVYWEYVEKVRAWVKSKGQSLVDEGSQSRAVLRRWQQYGIVRESDYPGILPGQPFFDHEPLMEELKSYLDYVAANSFWDEEKVVAYTRLILDKYMGPPPSRIELDGRSLTSLEYFRDVVRLNPEDYVEFMSFLYVPFWTRGEYRVPDNWWHGQEYLNVPLDEWYAALAQAVGKGFSACIGGDISEPGYIGAEDIAVIPSFDIPAEAIGQEAREYRFFSETTQDDHGIHLVGLKKLGGHDWYLVKDSGRSSQRGEPGYYFYRDDYIRLKMLTYMVHRDAVPGLLARFQAEAPPAAATR